MNYGFPASRILASALLLCVGLPLGASAPDGAAQAVPPSENLHSVLSRHILKPPLRSGSAYVRFSPDGRHLFAQDRSGVFLFSVEPLKFMLYLDAPDIFPASFTSDSQAVRIVSYDLRVATRKIGNLQQLDVKQLPVKDGCLSVAISPDGEKLSCYQTDFSLSVYDLSTGNQIRHEALGDNFMPGHRAGLPLDTDGVYAEPIGMVFVDAWTPLANRGRRVVPLIFSPQSRELLVGDIRGDGFRFDVQTGSKSKIPGAVRDRLNSVTTWLEGDRVIARDTERPHNPQIVSLQNGAVQPGPALSAERIWASDVSRYLMFSDDDSPGTGIFDLTENRVVDTPDNLGLGISGSNVALLADSGELRLCHLGEKSPYGIVRVPLGNLPQLRFASMDPSLNTLAIAIDGRGAIFSTENANRIGSFSRFVAARVDEPGHTTLTMPRTREAPAKILRFDTTSGSTIPVSSIGNETLRSGGSVICELTYGTFMGKGIMLNQRGEVVYSFRVLDSATGSQLWKRNFLKEAPVPFPDPQGERLVLGWRAKSDEAGDIAQHYPAAKHILRKAKLDDHDSFFEVLDARSGKPVGGVLVQIGSHASSFDVAFSVGDTLVLVKDGVRVSLYSLSDGGLKAKLVGNKPAATAATNLLALNEGAGKMTLYEMRSGAKVDQFLFPDEIVYSHFSEDGKRLFVLTQHQFTFVLDVSSVKRPPSAATTSPS